MDNKIQIKDYPQLDAITWDYHAESISCRDAFCIYERRWVYVDRMNICDKELELIAALTMDFGGGIFMPLL